MVSRVKRYFLEIKSFSSKINLNLADNYKIVLIKKSDYQLNIIDNNVNMDCLTNKDYIVLRNDLNNKYEIIRNEII